MAYVWCPIFAFHNLQTPSKYKVTVTSFARSSQVSTCHALGWQRRWMAENFLRIRTWDGVLMGHPPSICVTWWSPRRDWSSCRRKHSKNLCRTITLKLQLIQNLKYWRLRYVVAVVFLFCDPHESFTNHCVFHIFSGLFLAVSLWDNPFLAGHNSQRGKSHSSLFLATCIFCLTLVPHLP